MPNFEYRHVGRTELRVSPLCVDTMLWGGVTDAATAERMVESMRGAGLDDLPAGGPFGIGVVPSSSIARGVLGGKYLPDREAPSDSRARIG